MAKGGLVWRSRGESELRSSEAKPHWNHRFSNVPSIPKFASEGCCTMKRTSESGHQMQIGIVGLGRMGANIARRLMRSGHQCVVFDANLDASLALGREGATSSAALQDLVKRLKAPRTVWLMLPAGAVTETAITELSGLLARDDTIIDGGNSFWKDDIARAARLRERGIHYLDVGTSGGVWGLDRGYCLMIGGEKE